MSNQDFNFDPDAPPKDDTVAWIRRQQQGAIANTWPSPDDDPDRLARAMDLSKSTGVPTSLIYGNQEDFERQHKMALTSSLLRNNKFLMDYAQDPLAAKVSDGDWAQLDAISEALGPFARGAKSAIQKGAEGFKDYWGGPWGGWLPTAGDDYRLAWSIATAAGIPFELIAKVSGGIVGGTARFYGDIAKQMGYKNAPEITETIAQTVMDPASWASMGPIGEMVGLPFEIAGYNAKLARAAHQAGEIARKAAPHIHAGEPVPVGLHPDIDKLHDEQAKVDAKAFDVLSKEVDKSATLGRNPDLVKRFIEQHTDATIGISHDALLRLYGEDGVPKPGDNKLGWIPGIEEKFDIAKTTKGDVEVPLSDWLTKASPETKEAVGDGLRLRRGGKTLEEAKQPAVEVSKVEEAPPPEEAPSPTLLDTVRETSGLVPKGWDFVEPAIEPGIIPKKTLLGEVIGGYDVGPINAIHSFPTSEAVATIDKSRLTGVPKVLAEFFGNKINELVGNIPVHVISEEEMSKFSRGRQTPKGIYEHNLHQIFLTERTASGFYGHNYAAHVVMHEAAHAITARALEESTLLRGQVRALMNETISALEAAGLPGIKKHYGFKNESEFVAEAFSNPQFQELLSTTQISKELSDRFGLVDRGTHWDALKRIIKDLIEKLVGKRMPDTVLDGLLHMGPAFEAAHRRIEARGEVGVRAFEAPPPKQLELPGITRIEDRPLFERANAIGLKGEELAEWLKLLKKRGEEDDAMHKARALAQERQYQTKEWKENLKTVREEVKTQLNERPDLAADRFVREGIYLGEKAARGFRLQRDAVPPELATRLPEDLLGDRGVHPDDIAQLFGYHSGEQMLQGLARLEDERKLEGLTPAAHFTRLVDALTDREMKARYGDLDENILTEMRDHVVSQTQLDMIHQEVLAMAAKAGTQLPITKDELKRQVKMKFNATDVDYHSVSRYLDNAAKAEREIQAALVQGRALDAFKAYQYKYLNFLFANEAKALQKDLESFQRFVKRNSARERDSLPGEYSNWIHDILNRIGYPVRRLEDLRNSIAMEREKSLSEFVQKRNTQLSIWGDDSLEVDGFKTLQVADFLFNPGYTAKVEKMNPSEFRAVFNSLKSLEKSGLESKQFQRGQEKIELKEQISNSIKALAHAADSKMVHYTLGGGDEEKSLAKWVGAGVLQVETIFNRIDFGNPFGLFSQSYFRPLVEAINSKAAKEKEYAALWKGLSNYGDMNKQIDNPFIKNPHSDQLEPISRSTMLAIVQNLGNPSNMDKLLRGYKVPEELYPAFMQWVFANTTKADWDRAQAFGDIWAKLFKEAEVVYHKITGVVPEKIELLPIQTPWGTYPGWYHPVIYDPRFPGRSTKLMGPYPMDDGSYFRVVSPSGYTKTRTGYAAPIQLNFDAVPARMKQVINDISMRQAVMEVSKVFYDTDFQNAMTKYWGKEYSDMLIPWLRDVASQARGRDAAQAQAESLLSFFRQNAVAMLIGINPSTFLKHGPTAAMNSIREVGSAVRFFKEVPGAARYAAEVLNLLTRDPERAERDWFFAMQGGKVEGKEWGGSQELQRRARNWIETFKGAEQSLFKRLGRFATLREWVIQAGSYPVAMSDLISAVPTWLAVYKDAIAYGLDHDSSVYAADRAVRRAHGSSAITSRSRIQRGGEVAQFVTPFYTFFNTMLQRQYDLTWQGKEGAKGREYPYEVTGPLDITLKSSEYHEPELRQIDYKTTSQYKSGLGQIHNQLSGIWAYVVFPAIVAELVSPLTNDERESWGMKGAKMLTHELASSWPILRDFVEGMMFGRDPSVGLYSTSAKTLADAIRDMRKPQPMSRNHMGKFIRHSITAMGAGTGVTNAQMGRTGEFIYNYATGQDRPHGLKELGHGIWHGRSREERRQ